jgi:signal transduction histidine kinase
MIMHTDSLGNKYISITAVDLTEKKKTENELLKTNAELLELYNRLQSIREDERSEIAKEVHDELGQYLTMLKIDSLWLLEHLNTVDKLFEQRLKNLAANTQYTIDTSRKLMNTLNPGMLQDMGLTATMQWHARTFINSTSIPVLLDIIPAEINFNPKINLCLYRIFQESLTNVLRYANASKVNAVLIYYPDIKEVTLEINDNGVGFDTSKINSLHSHGINGMKERVAALKGIFKITSVPEKGTSVFVKINNADSYQL